MDDNDFTSLCDGILDKLNWLNLEDPQFRSIYLQGYLANSTGIYNGDQVAELLRIIWYTERKPDSGNCQGFWE